MARKHNFRKFIIFMKLALHLCRLLSGTRSRCRKYPQHTCTLTIPLCCNHNIRLNKNMFCLKVSLAFTFIVCFFIFFSFLVNYIYHFFFIMKSVNANYCNPLYMTATMSCPASSWLLAFLARLANCTERQ